MKLKPPGNFQCPDCGVPVDALEGGAHETVSLEPCGHIFRLEHVAPILAAIVYS